MSYFDDNEDAIIHGNDWGHQGTRRKKARTWFHGGKIHYCNHTTPPNPSRKAMTKKEKGVFDRERPDRRFPLLTAACGHEVRESPLDGRVRWSKKKGKVSCKGCLAALEEAEARV